LIVAGVIAAAIGIYHMSHRALDPKVAAEVAAGTTASSNDSGSTAPPPTQPVAATTSGENVKNDESVSTPTAPAQETSATPKEGPDRAKPNPPAARNAEGGALAVKQALAPAANSVSPKSGAAAVPAASAAPPSTVALAPSAAAADNSRAAPDNAQTDVVATKATAVFRLSIRPWATVLVDGSMKGVSPPLKRLLLPAGKHQIRLVNPSFPDHTVDILVDSKKKSGTIHYDFSPQ
jgi:hypothetical protein